MSMSYADAAAIKKEHYPDDHHDPEQYGEPAELKGGQAMKLTIEGILEDLWKCGFYQARSGLSKDIIRGKDGIDEDIAHAKADIQAYVKQEMRKIVPKAINDIQDTINATEGMFEPEVEAIAYEAGWGACICSILTAIENYGKEK